jgi:hypothetical protein
MGSDYDSKHVLKKAFLWGAGLSCMHLHYRFFDGRVNSRPCIVVTIHIHFTLMKIASNTAGLLDA